MVHNGGTLRPAPFFENIVECGIISWFRCAKSTLAVDSQQRIRTLKTKQHIHKTNKYVKRIKTKQFILKTKWIIKTKQHILITRTLEVPFSGIFDETTTGNTK